MTGAPNPRVATSARGRRALILCLLLAGWASRAAATCNSIPETDQPFASSLGEVSTAFGTPGHEVTVTRKQPVFAFDPARNRVTLAFDPPDGPPSVLTDIAALPPATGSGCPPERCVGGNLCGCLRFTFPDTSRFADGPLTGPVTIRASRPTAR